MASSRMALLAFLLVSLAHMCMGSRKLASLVQTSLTPLTYHGGAVLKGDISIHILWYGDFTPTQKSILSDFLLSLSPSPQSHQQQTNPSVSQWWNTINQLYLQQPNQAGKKEGTTQILLASQISDEKCSMGKSLTMSQISELASKAGAKAGGIAVVLTAKDVAVEGFCMSQCGLHGSDPKTGAAYIWVGDSAVQCPGQCAWPFAQPMYGPQTPPLVAPNGDVGVDGMVINLGSMLAGTVTNPFKNGYYQGEEGAALEAATACSGVYGKGAYQGYAGALLVDHTTGASYNANGADGRKYMLPALFNPSTSTCSTLV